MGYHYNKKNKLYMREWRSQERGGGWVSDLFTEVKRSPLDCFFVQRCVCAIYVSGLDIKDMSRFFPQKPHEKKFPPQKPFFFLNTNKQKETHAKNHVFLGGENLIQLPPKT